MAQKSLSCRTYNLSRNWKIKWVQMQMFYIAPVFQPGKFLYVWFFCVLLNLILIFRKVFRIIVHLRKLLIQIFFNFLNDFFSLCNIIPKCTHFHSDWKLFHYSWDGCSSEFYSAVKRTVLRYNSISCYNLLCVSLY